MTMAIQGDLFLIPVFVKFALGTRSVRLFFLGLCITGSFSSFRFHFKHHVLRLSVSGQFAKTSSYLRILKREFLIFEHCYFLVYYCELENKQCEDTREFNNTMARREQIPGTS